MDRITIIGLGPIGVSIGLALRRNQLKGTEIVGISGKREVMTAATKIGAVDKTTSNLASAVDGAYMLIVDTPLNETRELLEALGPVLEHGCVVTDTGAAKIRALEWAEAYLPRGVNYVGGHPLPKKPLRSLDDADAALFDGIDYCVFPGKHANEESVKTVLRLVSALGANPLFLDPHEHDSYAAAMNYLPLVLSSAFVTTTAGSEGWREMHKLAASEFSDFSRLASEDPLDNEVACLANPDALIHWLDQMILELYSYRNQIKEGSDELIETLVKAWEARARWEVDAVVPEEPKLASAADSMASAMLGDRLAQRLKQLKDGEGKKNWKYSGRG